MLSLNVDGKDFPFLVDTGATFSTITAPPVTGLLSSKTVEVVGFEGVGQTLPVTFPLKTILGKQALSHPYVVSTNTPVNLLGRDLLIKLGANILCSPDGLTVTLPDGTSAVCGPETTRKGQYLVQPVKGEIAEIYWGLLIPEKPDKQGILSQYFKWRPWISLLEPYFPPPDPPHVTLFYDRQGDEVYREGFGDVVCGSGSSGLNAYV